jgi:8-oxo-dGTP pyrophosphatase MutT (NUDIX family)
LKIFFYNQSIKIFTSLNFFEPHFSISNELSLRCTLVRSAHYSAASHLQITKFSNHQIAFYLHPMNEQHNPWTILSQEEKYDNKWINVTQYDVINPSGGKGIYGKLHYKNIAMGIVALDDEMNTYIVGQYRFVLNQYSWEIPEGGCPIDEEQLAAAHRELLEETGLKAKNWKRILEMYLSNSVGDEFCAVYVATGLSQHNAMPEETEQIVVKKLPFEEVYKMVKDGVITDAVSVAAIQKVKLMLLEGSLF